MNNQITKIIQDSIDVKLAVLKSEAINETLSSCVKDIVTAFKNGNKGHFRLVVASL